MIDLFGYSQVCMTLLDTVKITKTKIADFNQRKIMKV